MAQVIVRNLDDKVRDKLRALAKEHGRSMEEEIREILKNAVLKTTLAEDSGLGTRIAERFRRYGFDKPIEEMKDEPAKPTDLQR